MEQRGHGETSNKGDEMTAFNSLIDGEFKKLPYDEQARIAGNFFDKSLIDKDFANLPGEEQTRIKGNFISTSFKEAGLPTVAPSPSYLSQAKDALVSTVEGLGSQLVADATGKPQPGQIIPPVQLEQTLTPEQLQGTSFAERMSGTGTSKWGGGLRELQGLGGMVGQKIADKFILEPAGMKAPVPAGQDRPTTMDEVLGWVGNLAKNPSSIIPDAEKGGKQAFEMIVPFARFADVAEKHGFAEASKQIAEYALKDPVGFATEMTMIRDLAINPLKNMLKKGAAQDAGLRGAIDSTQATVNGMAQDIQKPYVRAMGEPFVPKEGTALRPGITDTPEAQAFIAKQRLAMLEGNAGQAQSPEAASGLAKDLAYQEKASARRAQVEEELARIKKEMGIEPAITQGKNTMGGDTTILEHIQPAETGIPILDNKPVQTPLRSFEGKPEVIYDQYGNPISTQRVGMPDRIDVSSKASQSLPLAKPPGEPILPPEAPKAPVPTSEPPLPPKVAPEPVLTVPEPIVEPPKNIIEAKRAVAKAEVAQDVPKAVEAPVMPPRKPEVPAPGKDISGEIASRKKIEVKYSQDEIDRANMAASLIDPNAKAGRNFLEDGTVVGWKDGHSKTMQTLAGEHGGYSKLKQLVQDIADGKKATPNQHETFKMMVAEGDDAFNAMKTPPPELPAKPPKAQNLPGMKGEQDVTDLSYDAIQKIKGKKAGKNEPFMKGGTLFSKDAHGNEMKLFSGAAGSQAGWEKDENGNIKYNFAKGAMYGALGVGGMKISERFNKARSAMTPEIRGRVLKTITDEIKDTLMGKQSVPLAAQGAQTATTGVHKLAVKLAGERATIIKKMLDTPEKVAGLNDALAGSKEALAKLPPDLQNQTVTMRREIDGYSQKIIDGLRRLPQDVPISLGERHGTPASIIKTIESQMGKYVRQSRETPNLNASKAMQEDFIKAHMEKYPESTRTDAEVVMHQLEDKFNGGAAGVAGTQVANKSLLMARSKLEPYEKAFLDVSKNPLHNYLETVNSQTKYIARLDQFHEWAQDLKNFPIKADPEHTYSISTIHDYPVNEAGYGEIANRFVNKEMRDFLGEVKPVADAYDQAANVLLRGTKAGYTVLNIPTHANQILGNMENAVLSRILPITPKRANDWVEAFKAVTGQNKDYVNHLVEVGILEHEFSTDAAVALLHKFNELGLVDKSLMTHAKEVGGKFVDAAGSLFAKEDQLPKIVAFRKFLSEGMTERQAVAAVYERWPNYDTAGKLAKRLSGQHGALFPFVKFPSESLRIVENAWRRGGVDRALAVGVLTWRAGYNFTVLTASGMTGYEAAKYMMKNNLLMDNIVDPRNTRNVVASRGSSFFNIFNPADYLGAKNIITGGAAEVVNKIQQGQKAKAVALAAANVMPSGLAAPVRAIAKNDPKELWRMVIPGGGSKPGKANPSRPRR